VSITALTVLGHTVLGFEQAYLTPVVGVAAALGTEILLESVDAFAHHRRPKYLGRTALDFLLPAYIAGLACAMLLYANDLLMPTALAAVVGVASKYVVRIPVGPRLRHVLNPSNAGIVTVLLIFIIGCGLGLFAGFKGKWWDTIIMRITDAQLSIPMIILAITILGVSRPTVPTIIIVLALSGWPLYARVARSAAVTERGKEYVRGLRVLGAGDWRILLLFAAPNILPPIAFVAVLDVARMMIFEAILGFLGLGIQPPAPSFGSIIADSRKYLLNAWWIGTIPGIFLAVALTSINLMGSALEKARNRIYGGL